MSSTAKTVIAVIVVIVLIGVGYWYVHSHASNANQGAAVGSVFNHTGSTATAQLPGGSSDSDAALNQDTAAIDTQLNGLNSDNANVTAAQNDQAIPIPQQ